MRRQALKRDRDEEPERAESEAAPAPARQDASAARADADKYLRALHTPLSKPAVPPFLCAKDGALVSIDIDGSYACAAAVTTGAVNSEGVIWLPESRGSVIVRTLLHRKTTPITLPAPLVTLANGTIHGLVVTLAADVMLPTVLSAGSSIGISPIAGSQYYLARLLSGFITIRGNGTAINSNTIAGDVAGAYVADTRDLQDFEATRICTRALYTADKKLGEKLATGITFVYPGSAADYTGCLPSIDRCRGQLIYSGQGFNTSNVLYASPWSTASSTEVPSIPFLALPPIPWGAVPSFCVVVPHVGGFSAQSLLHVIYVFAYADATGAHAVTDARAYNMPTNTADDAVCEVHPPASLTDPRQRVYLGTFFQLDNAAVSVQIKVEAFLNEQTEKELSHAFIARIDGADPGVGITVAGAGFQQAVPSAANGDFVKAEPLRAPFTPDAYYEALTGFMAEYPERRFVYPGALSGTRAPRD